MSNFELVASRRRRAFICMTLTSNLGDNAMSLGAVLPIVLVIGGGSFYGTGYYGGGA
jgi:hypothetical protein